MAGTFILDVGENVFFSHIKPEVTDKYPLKAISLLSKGSNG